MAEEFKMVKGRGAEELEREVNNLLGQGWKISGPAFAGHGGFYFQPMTKEKSETQIETKG